jgi:DNA repair protein RadA/Sms
MHTKTKTTYICESCGESSSQWSGQCAACLAWNTLASKRVMGGKAVNKKQAQEVEVVMLDSVKAEQDDRIDSGCQEFNRVLGGGLVPSSVVLLGGDPGIGKSTLLLQVMSALSEQHQVLYVSAEESVQQIAMRAKRSQLATKYLPVMAHTNLEEIIETLTEKKAKVVVIDSIQTINSQHVVSAAGSVAQVRYCANELVRYAKTQGCTLFLVGHVTKEGMLAGPRVLEHLVDTVLYFESKNNLKYRMIRAVKNRFGPVNELAVYAMVQEGLKAIHNPSAMFLNAKHQADFGSVITAVWEGTRPLLIEVQALVDTTLSGGTPRRVVVGYDNNRVAMLLAVMHRYMGVSFHQKDVFINVVGGLKITETALDLALVLALYSSFYQKPLSADSVIFGEVGLSGELRGVAFGQERLAEAHKQGLTRAIVPEANLCGHQTKHTTMKVQGVIDLQHYPACLEKR